MLWGTQCMNTSPTPTPTQRNATGFVQEHSSGLFTLGVVSYCLGVALVCERLNLSHEVCAVNRVRFYIVIFGRDSVIWYFFVLLVVHTVVIETVIVAVSQNARCLVLGTRQHHGLMRLTSLD